MSDKPRILLFRGKGLISRLIRWQTNGDYSHLAIQFPDGTIYEAWHKPAEFRKRPPLTDWSNVDAFDIVGLTDEGAVRMREWCEANLGAKYDFSGVLRFLSRRRKRADDKWFCSEAGFECVRYGGVELLHRIVLAQASPTVVSFSPLLSPSVPYGIPKAIPVPE